MTEENTRLGRVADLEIPWERDVFWRTLVRELSGVLEDAVGIEEASGFISLVGRNTWDMMGENYRKALEVSELSREQLAEVLVDLKARIRGDFYVIEQDDEKIVPGNRACPFAEKVLGRESMYMTTSNVFGSIAAENLGYGKVELQGTIARGDAGCRMVVYLRPTEESEAREGREYFRAAGA